MIYPYRVAYITEAAKRFEAGVAYCYHTTPLDAVTFADRAASELAAPGSSVVMEAHDGTTWQPQITIEARP